MTYRRLLAIAMVSVLVLASCGTAGDEAAELRETAEATTTTGDTDTRSPTSIAAPDRQAEREPLTLPAATWDDLEEQFLPALGGVRFGVRPEYSIHHDANMVVIRPRFELDSGRYLPSMILAMVRSYPDGTVIETLDDFIGPAISAVGTAASNGMTLSLLGQELDGYSFRLNDDQPVGPHYLFSAYGEGAQGPTAWQPFPVGEFFLADVPDGVMAIGYTASNEAELQEAREIFETVAPTIAIDETPTSDEEPQPVEPVEELREVAPLQLGESGPPVLTQGFSPIDPGTYRIANLATPMEVTFDDGWVVQPNFPGFVTFTGDDSFGPGDRGVVFRLGVASLVPATVGPEPVGPSLDVSDMSNLIEDPPTNLEVSNVQSSQIGGLPATQFDVRFTEGADCSASDPCQYLFRTEVFPLPEDLRTGYVHRIWHITQGVEEPLTVFAMSPDESWLPRAEQLLETIKLGQLEY
jgi:hypothetical protein